MIIETTHYHALPGQADAVLAQRRLASAVRLRLGLPSGRIFTKLEGAGPAVRWECTFASRAAYDADMAARAASPEFADARRAMHSLIERFERHLEQPVDP
ncbi:MAG: hypothetical protein ABIP61_11290 [Burkholderiaceae bacterium]